MQLRVPGGNAPSTSPRDTFLVLANILPGNILVIGGSLVAGCARQERRGRACVGLHAGMPYVGMAYAVMAHVCTAMARGGGRCSRHISDGVLVMAY